MSATEYSRKLDEIDRLLNDPHIPLQPDRIWSLLADVARHELVWDGSATPGPTTRRAIQLT